MGFAGTVIYILNVGSFVVNVKCQNKSYLVLTILNTFSHYFTLWYIVLQLLYQFLDYSFYDIIFCMMVGFINVMLSTDIYTVRNLQNMYISTVYVTLYIYQNRIM